MDSNSFDLGRLVNVTERKAIILWDYANCPVPSGVPVLTAVRNIREAALKFGSIEEFDAYSYWSNNTNASIKDDLSISGVKLRDCPYHRQKDAIDKTILIDMMVYALERPRTTTVILVSGDRDYGYAVSTLRNRGYSVKLLTPIKSPHSGLQALAELLDWNAVFRRDKPQSEWIDSSALARDEEEDETEEEETEATEEEEEEDAVGGREEVQEQKVEMEVEGREGEKSESESEVAVEQEQKGEEKVGMAEVESATVQEEPAPPSPLPFNIPSPSEIGPTWSPAPPELPSLVVPLEPLSALHQRQPETPRPPPVFSPTPLAKPQTPRPPPVFSPTPPTQPQVVTPSSGGGSTRPATVKPQPEQPVTYIAPKFLVLVEELKALKAEGSPQPLWSAVCLRVYKRLPSVLTKAGVKKWREYMLLAQKEGIVILKVGRPGEETVSLKT